VIDLRSRHVSTRLLVGIALVAAASFAAIATAAGASSSPATTISSRHTEKAGVVLVAPRGQTLHLLSRPGSSSPPRFALIGATIWGVGRRAARKPGEPRERTADPDPTTPPSPRERERAAASGLTEFPLLH
jgi:hypothetical protein